MKILPFMQRRAFRSVLRELAETDPDTFMRDGEVNQSAMARAIGVSQATMNRIFKNANYEPGKKTIDGIVDYFNVSAAQARGEESLAGRRNPQISGRMLRLVESASLLTPDELSNIESTIALLTKGRRRPPKAVN